MTPPEGCHRYREQIGALVLGKLDGGQLEAMRAHLDGCLYCQAEVRELEPVVTALADADPDRIAGTSRRSTAHVIADDGTGGRGWPRRQPSS